ncbi:MAG: hypothetical protein KDI75_05435 [Xanthomonadales bacterium]|nr:hypothetical protein [Xanthomonadales bacterium]
MTDNNLKSLYAALRAGEAGDLHLDADRLSRLAAGELQPSGADVELLSRDAAAATAYHVARDLRADAHALSAALRPTAPRQTTTRRSAWPLALAASAGLFAVLFAARIGLAPAPVDNVDVANVPAAEPAPLFSGSFEPGVAAVEPTNSGVIFGGSFDSG